MITVIVPALNEGGAIVPTLQALACVRAAGGEIILVDGGSRDDTVARARPWVDRLLASPPGRARQMNVGASMATGDLLWFVHADSVVDAAALTDVEGAFAEPACVWSRFGVRLSGKHPLFRTIAALMNARSRISGIATGDQGIAVRRSAFEHVGGYPEFPLMEDVALSSALRARKWPACLPVRITTSSRRWERHGAWRTIRLMWSLRFAFWRGVDPHRLASRYRAHSRSQQG